MAKHKWVTEAIKAQEGVLSVWPSQEDLKSQAKIDKFFELVEKIGSDPRVTDVRRVEHKEHKVIFVFTIDIDTEA